jgi:catechol 2,3-dioxygenase-like lactoylglutathione lyase family enzyme
MLISHFFHVAIKTADLDTTVDFYTRVLGLVLHRRPAFDFQGAWLAPTVAGADAIFHVYAGDAARSTEGHFEQGTAAVDHLSLHSHGYAELRQRFVDLALPYRQNIVPGLPIWQLFVYDPNGILLELTFHAEGEDMPAPVIDHELQYRPRDHFFDASAYRQFGTVKEGAAS